MSALGALAVAMSPGARLAAALGAPWRWADADEGSPAYGILDPQSGDIIGSGDSPEDAINDALATVRAWTRPAAEVVDIM